MRLLLAEDSRDLALALVDGMQRHGFVVDWCEDGETAHELAMHNPYAALLLDRMLPVRDGLAVCRALRSGGSSVPILLLTALDAIEQRVDGLDAGADDYLVKPFAFPELLARTRALTRRTASTRASVLRVGALEHDTIHGELRIGERLLALSNKERMLLALLVRQPQRTFTHAQLLEQAWGMVEDPTHESLRTHIKNLRKKLGAAAGSPRIENVHGLGYRLVP